MANSRNVGSWGSDTNLPWLDPGTLPLTATPLPGTVGIRPEQGDGSPPTASPRGADAGSIPPTPTVPENDPAIEALDLAPVARTAAYALKAEFPTVAFTSGRRDKGDQARAMAGNVVSNRKWIEQTYKDSPLRKSLQSWVDDHPKAKTRAEIADGLLSVFDAAKDEEVNQFSYHLTGMAFDVQPVEKNAVKIKAAIRALAGLESFLELEGGLERWHAQFTAGTGQ